MNERQKKRNKEFSPEREARTTAAGLWRYGEDYRQAAEVVKQSKGDQFSPPAMYLIAHSVELSLKAFLRSRGATLNDLMNIGHGLQDLYAEAMRRHLQWLWPEASTFGVTVRLLDELNKDHAMRYIVNGSGNAPHWWAASGCAFGLSSSLHRHCLRNTYGREEGEAFAAIQRERGALSSA